jgi:hypothetical protein
VPNIAFIRVPRSGAAPLVKVLQREEKAGRITVCSGYDPERATVLQAHGHTHQYVTVIREPLQLYIGWYHLLRARAETGMPMWFPAAQVTSDLAVASPTVEDFLTNCVKNQMFRYFYTPLVKADFAYIGVYEQLERSFALLQAVAGYRNDSPLAEAFNAKAQHGTVYATTYDPVLFRAQCAQDYAYYDAGLDRFDTLCASHGV